MCGIFGYIGSNNRAAYIVYKGLKELEYRGYDSYGIFAITQKKEIFLLRKIGPLPEKIMVLPRSQVAFGHTRWSTHGEVSVCNAHPQYDCNKQLFLIHNGIIENFEYLGKKLVRCGHSFSSKTDSEIFIHLIEEEAKKNSFLKAVKRAFFQVEGLNAFVIYSVKDKSFVLIKNTSPIIIGKTLGGYVFASDPNALLPFTRRLFVMEDKNYAVITSSKVYTGKLHSKSTKKITFISYKQKYVSEKKGKYAHFMLKEILEQPKILVQYKDKTAEINTLAKKIQKSCGTYFIGSGSAGFAALFGTYIFSKLAGRHINVSFASEFGYYKDFLTDRSLVVAFSQSGETADVIQAVKASRKQKTQIVAITNVAESTLYRMADFQILLDAGQERCVLATKSFMAKIAVCILLASCTNNNGSSKKGISIITKTIDALNKLVSDKLFTRLQKVGDKLAKKQHVFVIGRGANYPLALEGALKIKEGSYVHAEGLAGGELKHGVIALIEKGTPCIILAPNDETYGDILSNAMELKSRGGYIIGIGSKKSSVFDEFISVPDISHGSYFLILFMLQFIGYYTALARGVNPDRPRNLAKSVTVK